ncbi:protein obstructor-E-like [Hetaerina americana]|uniref:protein obstructor-E-like n=1 Tax=Hetaerina americana TaxID=62018 RepID=UPI003A7F1AD3
MSAKGILISALVLCALVALATSAPQKPSTKRLPSSNRRPQPQQQRRPEPEPEETDEEFSDECPEPNGYFADATQCDKYYACTNGQVEERLCPDGMVFNDFSPVHEKCDLPFNIDCSKRPGLQPPKPSKNCPRQNGYFSHEDQSVCDKFYYCVDGKFNAITCPDGLVYNEKTGICTWPDEAKKEGCSSKEVFQFDCPHNPSTSGVLHPRYADPGDCQYFYVCINGEVPRRNGCSLGKVFNEQTKSCDAPKNVPECRDWYKDQLTDEEIEHLNRPKPKPKPLSSANIHSRTRGSTAGRRGGGGQPAPVQERVDE